MNRPLADDAGWAADCYWFRLVLELEVSRDHQQDQDEHHDKKSFHWCDLPGERLIAGILIPTTGHRRTLRV
jgi:hypothetical protein